MLNDIKRLIISITAKNFYWVTAGNISITLSGFLFTVVIARSFNPADYGLYATVISLILILSDLGELGIGGGLSSFLPSLLKQKDELNANKILKTTFLLQITISILIGLILIIFADAFSLIIFRSGSQNNINLLKLVPLGVLSFMIFNFINAALVAKEKFKKTFIIQNLYSYPKLILLLILIFLLKVNLTSILLVAILGPIIAFLGGIYLLNFNFLKIKGFYPLKKILGFSLFLAANKLFVSLFSRLDIIMLTSLKSAYEAGIYSAASRVAFIYPLVGGSLGTVLGPKYSRLNLVQALSFSKKVFILITGLVFSLLLMILLSPSIINFVFGISYDNSISVLQVLLIANIPFLLAIPTNNLLTYTIKKPQILAFSSLIQLLIIFSVNIFFIPTFGRFAPAISIGIASFVAMLISFLSVYYYSKKNG